MHVNGHPVLETLVADDDLFLEKLVRDEVLRPANYTGDRAPNIRTRDNRTLRRSQIETDVAGYRHPAARSQVDLLRPSGYYSWITSKGGIGCCCRNVHQLFLSQITGETPQIVKLFKRPHWIRSR